MVGAGRTPLSPPRFRWPRIEQTAPLGLAVVAAVVLVAVPWPLNFLLLAGGATFLVATISPPAAIGLAVASVPLQAVVEQSIGPFTLRFPSTVVAALTFAWFLGRLARGGAVRVSPVAVAFGAHVLVVALSGVGAGDVKAWAAELYRWSVALVVFVVAVDAISGAGAARPALLGMAVGTIGAGLLGIYQVVEGIGPASFNVGGLIRAYATFGQPNPFAGYLELTVPLLVAILGARLLGGRGSAGRGLIGPWLATVLAAAAGVGLIALVLTQSRGGWLGAMTGLGAVAWLTGGWLRWAAIAGAALVALVVVATPLGGRVTERLAASELSLADDVQVTTANFAARERLAHWRAGLAMARSRPVLGVGGGNFPHRFRDATPVWRFRIPRGHAHSAYVQAAAQTGFVGLATYLALLAAVGWRLRRALRSAAAGTRPLAVGAIGVTVAFATHNVFDYLHVLSLGVQLSVVWALAEAAATPDRLDPPAIGSAR